MKVFVVSINRSIDGSVLLPDDPHIYTLPDGLKVSIQVDVLTVFVTFIVCANNGSPAKSPKTINANQEVYLVFMNQSVIKFIICQLISMLN